MRPTASDYNSVRAVCTKLVRGVAEGDGKSIRECFWEKAVTACAAGPAPEFGDVDAFAGALDGHPAGPSLTAGIDVISVDGTAAFARVVENGPFAYTHYACLLCCGGQWRISSYVYNKDD